MELIFKMSGDSIYVEKFHNSGLIVALLDIIKFSDQAILKDLAVQILYQITKDSQNN